LKKLTKHVVNEKKKCLAKETPKMVNQKRVNGKKEQTNVHSEGKKLHIQS